MLVFEEDHGYKDYLGFNILKVENYIEFLKRAILDVEEYVLG